MLFRIDNSLLIGLRFLDSNGLLLLSVGYKQDSCWTHDPNYEYKRSHTHTYRLKQFELREGHFLVGAKSGSRNTSAALHYDFTFYIGYIEYPE